ncbi:MAG: RsmB/NOP family class I SAM-dependent RNA methyltransferase [Aigarchaeota archaeon]|nr:RsmB/NOP family class I SAM-dependent RNA methyltransferase [Candidatus Pelearchaeum maunauluense]
MEQRRITLSEQLLAFLRELPDIDLNSLIDAYSRPLPSSIRINTLKTNMEKCLSLLREDGYLLEKIPWTHYGYYVSGEENLAESIWHMLGLVYFQGPVSMLAAELLDVEPGNHVLDLCAAPGSKSTHIAQLLQASGVIVANDISVDRVKALASNMQKFGVINSIITLRDGRIFGKRYPSTFDRVLVDAPCSSLGIISKDWGVARRWSERISERISRLQLGLLLSGFDALKPGGKMIYSTCTLHPLENEAVVSELLEKRENAKLENINVEGIKTTKPVEEWRGITFHPDIGRCIRIYPYDSGAEGFFFAKIVKQDHGEA